MRKYSVTIRIQDEAKKIAEIKDIRQALGVGLVEARNLVETYNYSEAKLTLNGDQVAGLVNVGNTTSNGDWGKPFIKITSCVPLAPSAVTLDFSDIIIG